MQQLCLELVEQSFNYGSSGITFHWIKITTLLKLTYGTEFCCIV